MQHWTDAVGDLGMYELGIGGVLKAEDYYNATVRPHLATRTSYEKFCQDNPSGKLTCEAHAEKLQHDVGGLYVGMVDCVRAVLCDRAGGLEAHRGMCAACRALELNQAFRKRVERREAAEAAEAAGARTRNDYLTREALLGKHDAVAEQLRVTKQKAERARLAADVRAKRLGERAERAVAEASAMVHELCTFAVQATEAERAAAEVQVEAAAAAQLAAERQVEA